MQKILICCDKYKGTLTSSQVNQAILSGIKSSKHAALCDKVSMSDGGDGFLATIDNLEILNFKGINALHQTINIEIGYKNKIIYIELAKVTGLVIIEKDPSTIWERSSFGLGKLISDILDSSLEVNNIIIGCGGSSTNDGGYGCLIGLGAIFRDSKNNPLNSHTSEINKIKTLDIASLHPKLKQIKIEIIADVQGPLLGKNGCTELFARQKGATTQDIYRLEQDLVKFQQLIIKSLNIDINQCEYGLCCGGLPAGLSILPIVEYHNGAEWVLKQTNLELKIAYCDIVISGEGMVDATTMHGKLISRIAKLCSIHQKPLIIIAGQIDYDLDELYSHGITVAFPIINKSANPKFSNSEYLISQRVDSLFRMGKLLTFTT